MKIMKKNTSRTNIMLDDSDKADIKRMLEEGKSHKEIALYIGMCPSHVGYYAQKYGITRKRTWSWEEKVQVFNDCKNMEIQEVAEKHKTTKQMVFCIRKEVRDKLGIS